MRYYFIISTIFFIFILIFQLIRKRKIATIPSLIFITVTLNFLLYLQSWTTEFILPCQNVTYFFIGTVELIFAGYAMLVQKKPSVSIKYKLKKLKIGNIRINVAGTLLFFCIILAMIENFYNGGSFIASDSSYHTATMPVIGPFLRALYPVSYILAFIEIDNNRSKIITIETLCCIAYSILGGGSRFWPCISLITTFFFICFYKKDYFLKIKLPIKVLVGVGLYVIFNIFMLLGTSRNTLTYAELIHYTGPFMGTEIGNLIAWFYGYFPYSYYNLNYTLYNILNNKLYTYGQFLLYPFVALLKLDDLFGINYSNITFSRRVYENTAATVATGYFEFFADFGYAFAIGIFVLLFITRKFEKRHNFFNRASYSYMCCVWTMMCFLNVFTVGVVFYYFILMYLINKFLIVNNTSEI